MPRVRKVTSPDGLHEFRLPTGAVYDEARADRAVRFISRHLRHIKGRWAGQAFVLEPWQEWLIIRPLFGVVDRKTKRRWYREALIGLPRKNGKSEIAAAIALYMLLADGEQGPEVYSLAGDRKQASLVFNTAAQMVRASPLLRAACKTFRSVIEVAENNGLYRALSSDADLQHGLNPSCAIVDEYHVHKNAEQYEAMRTGTAARLEALVVTITTAGPVEKGPLWELHKRAMAGNDPRLFVLWMGASPEADATDPDVWRAANPASWITDEFLADQFRSLPLPVFERLHLNRWPSAKAGAWVPIELWEDCGSPPHIDPDKPCIVAVDAAPRRDLTAVVLDQRDANGVHNVKCWTFEADPTLGYLDFDLVEGLLRQLASEFYVTRIVVDPYAMIRSMMTLAAEGLPVEDFPQNHSRMVPASMGLHQLIIDQCIAHGGDEALDTAVRNAAIRETAFGWRLEKARASERIDPAVALAMATRIAEQESQYEDGPTVMVV